ncbi:AAA family ATPase [Paracoccus litorisediminis]
MLKVRRTTPSALFFDTIDEPRERLLRWAHRSLEERRQRRAPIDHDLFHGSDLAEMVYHDFDGACAFCERPVDPSDGVSHFRPLSIDGDHDGERHTDHYSWLAYEWLNLFLICRICQKQRSDKFYVTGRRARFLATFDEVRAEERPLLIDPTIENPASHLSFLFSGECIPKRSSAKAKVTVDLLALNDDELVYRRHNAIETVVGAWKNALQDDADISGVALNTPFFGAWRDVLARTLSEFGIATLGASSGHSLVRRLRDLIEKNDRNGRDRMAAAIDLVRNSDQIRQAQFHRESAELERVFYPAIVRLPDVGLRAPQAEIKCVQITNFKAIDRLDISLREARSRKSGASCLMLLGENAVGKSTCLSAIALALLGTREAQKLRLSYSDLARSQAPESWDVWGREPLEVRLQLDAGSEPAIFIYDPVRGGVEGSSEQSTIVLGYGPHRYFAKARGRRGTSAAHGVRSLFDSRQALPDPTEWLDGLRGRAFDEVARTIRTILPVGDDDQLVNDTRSGICVFAQGQLTPVGQLSEGYRSVFAMVTDICRNLLEHWSNLEIAHGVVLVDEIETHLHPRWKMRVMSSLREAFPRIQFVVTTHDPLCVRGMDDGEVVVLARNEKGGITTLADLPDVSGMRVEQLLTSEYFGLSSTIDPELNLEIARLSEGVARDPSLKIGVEADKLISRLTVGDSASAQIIQEALLRYLQEREKPSDALGANARADAVKAVFLALRSSRAG